MLRILFLVMACDSWFPYEFRVMSVFPLVGLSDVVVVVRLSERWCHCCVISVRIPLSCAVVLLMVISICGLPGVITIIRCLLSSSSFNPVVSSVMSLYNTRSKRVFSVLEAIKLAKRSAMKSRPSKRTILVDIDPMFFLKGRLDVLAVKANFEVSFCCLIPSVMLLMFFVPKVKYVWGELDPNDWWDMRAEMAAAGWGDPTEAWVEHLRDTGRFPPPVSFIALPGFVQC